MTAASLYLPNHIGVIYNRIWYYLHGEFANMTAGGDKTAACAASSFVSDGLRITSEALLNSVPPAAAAVGQTGLREL